MCGVLGKAFTHTCTWEEGLRGTPQTTSVVCQGKEADLQLVDAVVGALQPVRHERGVEMHHGGVEVVAPRRGLRSFDGQCTRRNG